MPHSSPLVLILVLIFPITSSNGSNNTLSGVDKKPYEMERNNNTQSKFLRDLLSQGLQKGVRSWDGEDEDSLIPPWANPQLLLRGQQFAMDNVLNVLLSSFYGLTLLLANPHISSVLLFTDKSSTKKKAAVRYGTTMLQVLLWMRRALEVPLVSKKYNRNTKSNWVLTSIAQVHRIHDKVALKLLENIRTNQFGARILKRRVQYRKSIDKGLWDAFRQDLEESYIPKELRVMPPEMELDFVRGSNTTSNFHPMSQFAFAMTQWAFMGIILIQPTSVLAYNPLSTYDKAAFAHFWGNVGHAIGLEDEFNIARNKNVTATLEEVFKTCFIPTLFNLQDENKILMEAYLQGVKTLISDVGFDMDNEFILRAILRDVLGIPIPHLNARRSPQAVQLDWWITVGSQIPSLLFPAWNSVFSPVLSLYHFRIGDKYCGPFYSSDENVAKNCFY